MATIKEVKEQLATLTDLDDHRWASFEEDSRAGVQTAIKQRRKAIQAEIAEEERLEMMLSYEKSLYAQGIELIAGVDEVQNLVNCAKRLCFTLADDKVVQTI